jgi:hypothetical protein
MLFPLPYMGRFSQPSGRWNFYHNSNSTDVGSSPNVLLKVIWFLDADMVAIAVQSDITIKSGSYDIHFIYTFIP